VGRAAWDLSVDAGCAAMGCVCAALLAVVSCFGVETGAEAATEVDAVVCAAVDVDTKGGVDLGCELGLLAAFGNGITGLELGLYSLARLLPAAVVVALALRCAASALALVLVLVLGGAVWVGLAIVLDSGWLAGGGV
jgi:hypothetical protein